MIKQAIVIRKDLKMGKGKIVGQCCHASLKAYEKTDSSLQKQWNDTYYTKVVLKCNSLEEILDLEDSANNLGISNFLVKDLGKTQIPEGTVTALGIGPDYDWKIDKLTSNLKLY